jgi:hypothetical protein
MWWSGATLGAGVRNGGSGHFLRDILRLLALPGLAADTFLACGILRFLSWNNLALLPLAVFGLLKPSAAPGILRSCAWGIVLTVVAFWLVLPNQGHGWGYRYLHGLIGNAVLLAVAGWVRLTEAGPERTASARLAVLALTLATLCLLVLRAVQVEAFVAPMARALAVLRLQPASVVVVDNAEIWYGADLAQNDPYLRNSPKIMALTGLDPQQIARLCPLHPIVLGPEELARAGAAPPDWLRRALPGYDEARKALRACSQ